MSRRRGPHKKNYSDVPPYRRNMGLRFQKRRIELGLTQAEVAERAGVAQGRVSEFECGKGDPQVCTIIRLAATIDLELVVVSVNKDSRTAIE